MEVLLTHTTALEVLRRPDLQRRVVTAQRDAATVPDRAPTRAGMEAMLARSPLLAGLGRPLELLGSSPSARIGNDLVRTHVMSASLPAGSTIEVAFGVRVVSPELLPVLMAPRLTELELIVLLSELLGTYAIDLARQKGMWQRREPLTPPDRIRALLDALGPCEGWAWCGVRCGGRAWGRRPRARPSSRCALGCRRG